MSQRVRIRVRKSGNAKGVKVRKPRKRQASFFSEVMMEYTNSQIEYIIDERISNERNRKILKRRLIDGVCFEPLAEEFDLSVRQVQNIVYKGQEKIFGQLRLPFFYCIKIAYIMRIQFVQFYSKIFYSIPMEEIKELLMEIMKNEDCSPIYALYLLTKRLA